MGITDRIARRACLRLASAAPKGGSECHHEVSPFFIFHWPPTFGMAWGLGIPGGTAVCPAPIDPRSPGA